VGLSPTNHLGTVCTTLILTRVANSEQTRASLWELTVKFDVTVQDAFASGAGTDASAVSVMLTAGARRLFFVAPFQLVMLAS
jgi:hypothetical protein